MDHMNLNDTSTKLLFFQLMQIEDNPLRCIVPSVTLYYTYLPNQCLATSQVLVRHVCSLAEIGCAKDNELSVFSILQIYHLRFCLVK